MYSIYLYVVSTDYKCVQYRYIYIWCVAISLATAILGSLANVLHCTLVYLYMVCTGVGMALATAILGSLANVIISKCDSVSSSIMVLYSGLGRLFFSPLITKNTS